MAAEGQTQHQSLCTGRRCSKRKAGYNYTQQARGQGNPWKALPNGADEHLGASGVAFPKGETKAIKKKQKEPGRGDAA